LVVRPSAMKDKAQQIIDSLDLRAHPEGGFFREIFRSEQTVEWQGETLCAGTAIYFLLLDGDRSWCHRIPQDEVWQFFEGDPFELVFFMRTICSCSGLSCPIRTAPSLCRAVHGRPHGPAETIRLSAVR